MYTTTINVKKAGTTYKISKMTQRRQNTDNHQSITFVRCSSINQWTVSDIIQLHTGQSHKLLHAAFCIFNLLKPTGYVMYQLV